MSEIMVRNETQSNVFVEFFKKNQYSFYTALCVFSAGGLYYLSSMIKKKTKYRQQTAKDSGMTMNNIAISMSINNTPEPTSRQQPMSQQQESKQIKHSVQRLKQRRQKLLSLSRKFKVEQAVQQILTTLLSQQCVLNLFDVCKQLVDEQELNSLYNKNRKARRQVFHHILINAEIVNARGEMEDNKRMEYSNNTHEINITDSLQLYMSSPKNITTIKNNLKNKKLTISYPEALSFSQLYYRLVCTFEQEFKYLIQKTQKDFAVFLNIDFSLITQSIDFHISKQDNQYFKRKIEEWTSLIKQTLKCKLTKYNQLIHVDRVCDVLRSAIEYLQQKRDLVLQMVRKLGISDQEELQAIPAFIECVMEDEIYSRFGVEMEQIFVEMGQMDKNKQLQTLCRQYQQLTENIVHEMCEEVNTDAIHNNQLQDSIESQ